MLDAYRAVLRRPGAVAFAAAAVVGRMWLPMAPLGIVLLVSARTGRYGTAGAVSATFALVQSITAPVLGRLADRVGQRRVLLPLLAGHTAGVVGLVVAALSTTSTAPLLVAAAVAGAAAPPLVSLVRARWSALLGGGPQLQTAYAIESALDEVLYVTGPVLVAALATGIAPAAGLLASLALTVTGTAAYAAQRGTEPPPSPADQHAVRAHRVAGLRVVMATYLAIGVFFGSLDVTMVGFATEHGRRGATGWLLALIAVGSLCGGLWYGGRTWRVSLPARLSASCGLLAVCALSLAGAPSIATMAGAALVTGVAIAPSLITSSLLVQRLAPPGALTEAFGLLSAAIGLGFAVGAPLAGHLVDSRGPHVAFLAAAGAAALGTVLAQAGRSALAAKPSGPVTLATAGSGADGMMD